MKLKLTLTAAAASELQVSIADAVEPGRFPKKEGDTVQEVIDAIVGHPQDREAQVELSMPAFLWLYRWLRAEAGCSRVVSRYAGPEMFGAWRALQALLRQAREVAAEAEVVL